MKSRESVGENTTVNSIVERDHNCTARRYDRQRVCGDGGTRARQEGSTRSHAPTHRARGRLNVEDGAFEREGCTLNLLASKSEAAQQGDHFGVQHARHVATRAVEPLCPRAEAAKLLTCHTRFGFLNLRQTVHGSAAHKHACRLKLRQQCRALHSMVRRRVRAEECVYACRRQPVSRTRRAVPRTSRSNCSSSTARR